MITATETAHLIARLPQIMLEGRAPALPAADVLELGLREGQIVRPAVEVRGHALALVLQGREIDVGQAWRPLAGQPLALQVRLMADGSAQLRPPAPLPASLEAAAAQPASQPGAAQSAAGQPAALLADRLTQLLWRPSHLAGWLSLLQSSELRGRAAAGGPAADTTLLQAILPRMGALTGFALRAAVLRSGLFGESSLARAGEAPVLPDLKALLRDWQDGLGEDQAELRTRIGEAVDDIEAAQLQSVENAQPRELQLNLALGFADAPPLRLQIAREGSERDESGAAWTVNVRSRSERWGELSLQTRIFAQGTIELTMWAERERVCSLAREGARRLADELATAGLRLAGFQVLHGLRPVTDAGDEAPAGRLLDLRA
jgi:hypothetical protein